MLELKILFISLLILSPKWLFGLYVLKSGIRIIKTGSALHSSWDLFTRFEKPLVAFTIKED